MMKTLALPVVEQKATGVLLYDGPSLINGKRIIVVATGLFKKTENYKTGDLVQIWILVAGKQPLEANRQGLDESVCGSCKHRHFRSCYVNLSRGPLQVWEKWKANGYRKVDINDHATSELFRDRMVRLGAYGDPAAVPIEVWDAVTKVCAGWTGYTHRWQRKHVKPYRRYCMASCDTLEEARKAMRRGWKPFYVRQETDPLPPGFFACPASAEAGKRLTCEQCRVCKGGRWRRGQGVPTIIAHGPSWKRVFYKRGIKLMEWKEKYVGVFFKNET